MNFTDREKEIIQTLFNTEANTDLAMDRLSISRNTLKHHLKNIYKKAKVENLAALFVRALKHAGVNKPQI